jgi:hypothetical protein
VSLAVAVHRVAQHILRHCTQQQQQRQAAINNCELINREHTAESLVHITADDGCRVLLVLVIRQETLGRDRICNKLNNGLSIN